MKKLLSRISVNLLLKVVILGLIFSLKLFGIGIILLLLFITYKRLKSKSSFNHSLFSNKISLLLFGLYFLNVIGLLYSICLDVAFFSLEKKISFAILPIALSSIGPLRAKSVINIFSIFFLSLFVACIIIYTGAFVEYFYGHQNASLTNFINEYNRERLSGFSFIQYHHPYLGLYIATALLFIITNFSKLYFRTLYIVASCFLLLFFVQLEAKMSLIAFVITLIVYACIILKNHSYKLFIGFVIAILSCGVVVLSIRPSLIKSKVENVIYADGGSRIRNWESSVKAIKEAPFFGYGTGDKLEALQGHRNKAFWEYKQEYNSHNQYLDLTLGFGLVGLLYWLFLLGYILWKSYKLKSYFFSLFTILFSLCSFTEVLLERFQGIALFAVIYAIFANISGDYSKNVITTTLKPEKGYNT